MLVLDPMVWQYAMLGLDGDPYHAPQQQQLPCLHLGGHTHSPAIPGAPEVFRVSWRRRHFTQLSSWKKVLWRGGTVGEDRVSLFGWMLC